MIDTNSERMLTLAAAADEVPGRSARGGVHVATVWRWALRGARGIRLESVVVGGLRYTSREALQRFIERSTSAADGHVAPTTTPAQREKAIAAAERELATLGL